MKRESSTIFILFQPMINEIVTRGKISEKKRKDGKNKEGGVPI